MGVPKFYQWLKKRNSRTQHSFIWKSNNSNIGDISSLSIDMNGIIHTVAQKVYNYGDYENDSYGNFLEQFAYRRRDLDELFKYSLCNQLTEIVDKFNPKTLIIATDGVAPVAKIRQQRLRRYKAQSSETNLKVNGFSTAEVTPGTEFMKMVDEVIRNWKIVMDFQSFRNTTILYSSYNIPGEGETKIFDLLNRLLDKKSINSLLTANTIDTYPHIDANAIHVIHGLDADLTFYSLLNDRINIYLYRENIQNPEFIVISRLRASIFRDVNKSITMKDFVIGNFLGGNDFLPRMPFARFSDEFPERVIESLNTITEPLVIYHENSGKYVLNMRSLARFIRHYYDKSDKLYEEILKNPPAHQYQAIKASEGIVSMNTSGNTGNKRFVDHDKLDIMWYLRELFPTDTDFNNWIYQQESGLYPSEEQISNLRDTMCFDYLVTFNWIINYYLTYRPHYWWYTFNFTPLISDLYNFTLKEVQNQKVNRYFIHNINEEIQFVSKIHQLLLVIPPALKDLVPEKYRQAYDNEALIDLYPTQISFIYDGAIEDWDKKPALPLFNPERVATLIAEEVSTGDTYQRITSPRITTPSRSYQIGDISNQSDYSTSSPVVRNVGRGLSSSSGTRSKRGLRGGSQSNMNSRGRGARSRSSRNRGSDSTPYISGF